MNEYIINSGEFNILIRPLERKYYLLGNDEASSRVVNAFLANEVLDLVGLESGWFKYRADERWHDFSGISSMLNVDLSEDQLMDRFLQKKYNFGGLVAERNAERGHIKVFKRHKLLLENHPPFEMDASERH